jgi:hypothetical protein
MGAWALAAAVAACGPPAAFTAPSTGDPDPPPDRAPFDAGTSAPDAGTKDAGPGDADSGPPASSTTCAAADVVLCFTFENEVVDHSPSALAPQMTSNLAFGPGKEGQAAVFGTESALRFGPSPVLDLSAAHATVEAWIDRTAAGDAVVFDDDGRLSLTIDVQGKVWCKSSGGQAIGATIVATNKWQHVACVVDGGTLTAFLNGKADGTGAGAITPTPGGSAAIGGNSPTGEPFVGSIDSLRVFKASRTAADIAADAKP